MLGIFEAKKTLSEIIKELIQLPQAQFIIGKADLKTADIVLIDSDKNILSQSAFNLVKKLKGKYVTTMDFFTAYLLSIEPSAKTTV